MQTETTPETQIHPTAIVDEGAVIGQGTRVWHWTHISSGARIGPSAVFTNVINPRSHVPRKHEYRQTLVQEGASLGANATVVCGHTIGRFAMVGAGAVVTDDVPDYALMTGIPARRAGWMCACGAKLPDAPGQHTCADCDASYDITDTACVAQPQ